MNDDMRKYGFCVVSDAGDMMSDHDTIDGQIVQYTGMCSASRSDCCTRTCSADANFCSTAEDWEKYLLVKGGQVQY